MSALSNNVAPAAAREHVFVLTDANSGTRKRKEGNGQTDNKLLGTYGRDGLNETANYCCVPQKMLVSLLHSFAPLQVAYLTRSRAANTVRAKHASSTSR